MQRELWHTLSRSHTNLLSCFVTHQIQQMHQQRGPQLPWKDRLLGRAQTHLGHHRQNSRNTNTTQNTGSQHTDGHMDATKKRWVGGWNGGEQKNERSASGKVREYKKYATQHWILIYLKLKKIVSKGCIMLHSVSTEWIRQCHKLLLLCDRRGKF